MVSKRQSDHNIAQLISEVEHDVTNYQNQGLSYLLKLKAKAESTDTRLDDS